MSSSRRYHKSGETKRRSSGSGSKSSVSSGGGGVGGGGNAAARRDRAFFRSTPWGGAIGEYDYSAPEDTVDTGGLAMIFTQELRSAGTDEEGDASWLVPECAMGDFSADMKNNGNADEVKSENGNGNGHPGTLSGIGYPGTPGGTYLSGNEADNEL